MLQAGDRVTEPLLSHSVAQFISTTSFNRHLTEAVELHITQLAAHTYQALVILITFGDRQGFKSNFREDFHHLSQPTETAEIVTSVARWCRRKEGKRA